MHAPQMIQLSERTEYRADIDGLRAVAVLSVIIYHYSPAFPWRMLPGGFSGVDIFFVISGFLITSILASDIEGGRFSVLSFYSRRIRRIFPALLVMLAVTTLAGYLLLLPGDYKATANSAAFAAFGLSNFFFLRAGYFDQASELQPLLHTWSLAVEEQFYLIWPVAMFAILAKRSREDGAVLLAVLLIVAVGFAGSISSFATDPKAAFFLPMPRAWELALGAVLVFVPALKRTAGEIAAIAGLALIGAGFALASPASFPGFAALLPCVGAALIIWPRQASTVTARGLGVLAPIGLISYSLYLWHWPMWVFFRIYINNGTPRIREALALGLVSILLAVLSHRYIEKPFRRRAPKPAFTVLFGVAASSLVLAASIFVAYRDGFPERLSPSAYGMRSREAMWDWKCREYLSLDGREYCAFGAPWNGSAKKALLWGDSHAAHLAPLLDVVARDQGVAMLFQDACPAILGGHLHRRWPEVPTYVQDCATARTATLKILSDHAEIQTVVIASAWSTVATNDLYADNGRQTTSKVDLVADEIAELVKQLSPRWAVAVVDNMTGPGSILTECALASESRLLRRSLCPSEFLKIDSAKKRVALAPFAAKLDQLAGPNVQIVHPVDTMCREPDCLIRVNSEFIWMDYSHVRRNLSPQTNRELAGILGFEDLLKARPSGR